MAITVLVIDDSSKIRELLTEYLEIVGMKVITLADGKQVMETIETYHPDVVILDIIMPGIDGFSVLKRIKKKYILPVIMLTARGEDTDKIVGLELGADDYLTKPFNSRELEARIKASLRAYRSITTQTIKYGLKGLFIGICSERFAPVQTGVAYIIMDADGEMIFRAIRFKFIEYGLNHAGCKFLR